MVTIEPAKFIVRDKKYPQNREYPFACAELVHNLLRQDITSANDLFFGILDQGDALKECFRKADASGQQKGHYFTIRGSQFNGFTTQFENGADRQIPYQVPVSDIFDEELKPHTEGMSYRDIHYRSPTTHTNIALTRFSAAKNAVTGKIHGEMMHPDIMGLDPADYDKSWQSQLVEYMRRDEERWNCIAQEFNAALNKKLPQSEREDAAIRFYCLLSHDCPVERGSSTLTRIALEYLAARITMECEQPFTIPYTREEIDLHIQAKSRDPDSFVKTWREKNSVLFDHEVNAEEVLQWQAAVIGARSAGGHTASTDSMPKIPSAHYSRR